MRWSPYTESQSALMYGFLQNGELLYSRAPQSAVRTGLVAIACSACQHCSLRPWSIILQVQRLTRPGGEDGCATRERLDELGRSVICNCSLVEQSKAVRESGGLAKRVGKPPLIGKQKRTW